LWERIKPALSVANVVRGILKIDFTLTLASPIEGEE
jgi:hypothetical protein